MGSRAEHVINGATRIVATQADKARAWIDTGALAVDLESAVVARAAAAAGIPFLVLRAIADPATRHLPPARLNDGLVPLCQKSRRVANESLRDKSSRLTPTLSPTSGGAYG